MIQIVSVPGDDTLIKGIDAGKIWSLPGAV